MSLDSSIISYVVRKPLAFTELQRTGITADHFVEDYQKVWRWITRMKREHGKIPSPDVVQTRFKELDIHRVRDRDLPILIADLQQRKKYMDFLEALDEASREATGPEEIDLVLAGLIGNLNQLSVRNGKSSIVDLFSAETNERMLENLRKRRSGMQMGIPTGLKRFDLTTGGLQPGRMITVIGRPGLGKAQPLSAKILTPAGWKTMGSMRAGSKVVCPDGSVATVTKVHPQGQKDIYRITFSDGATTEATSDHLWLTQTRNERRRKEDCWSAKTTEEVASSLKKEGHWNHYVPLVSPIPGKNTLLPIHPYVIGALLGDGHVRTRGGATEVLLTSADDVLIEEANRKLAGEGEFKPSKKMCYRYVDGSTRWNKPTTFRQDIVNLGMGSGLAHEKRIPRPYMEAGPLSRLALLQGLLDTDGSPCGQTSAEFCTTSPALASQVRELVWSLGGVCTLNERHTSFTNGNGEKQHGRKSHRLMITLPENIPYFVLARKQNRILPGQKRGRAVRTIRSVEWVRTEEAQCITIDHPRHLYITDDYVVTHNSWLDLLFVARGVIHGAKVILYPLEMTLEETALRLYTLMSCRMMGPSKALKNLDLANGRISTKKIKKFLDLMQDKYEGQLLVADIGTMSDPYTVERIEAEVEIYKPDLFWVDYITLMKAPGVGRDGGEDHTTVKALSNGIKQISVRHGVVGGASAQVNRDAIKGRAFLPRIEHIAYGDAIGQDSDHVLSINRKDSHLYYAMVKNRHGPEVRRTRVKFFVDEGIIEETKDQDDDDDDD